MKRMQRLLYRDLARRQACIFCQHRSLHTTRRLTATPTPLEYKASAPTSAIPRAPTPKDWLPRKGDDFVARPLGRPIGFNRPPKPGENPATDTRTFREKRQDFFDKEKHLKKRQELKDALSQPYFQEMSALKWKEGKSFLANPKLFRSEVALYFPNLQGRTLASSAFSDTTDILRGKVSIVSIFSGQWAETQIETFVGATQNPDLNKLLSENKNIAQRVDINVESHPLRALILKMFEWNLRRQLPEEQHPRYFFLRKGINNEIRHTIGLLNMKVGYVYLLDANYKIRWAASGSAEGQEREYLNKGLARLIDEAKGVKRVPAPVKPELKKPERVDSGVDKDVEKGEGTVGIA